MLCGYTYFWKHPYLISYIKLNHQGVISPTWPRAFPPGFASFGAAAWSCGQKHPPFQKQMPRQTYLGWNSGRVFPKENLQQVLRKMTGTCLGQLAMLGFYAMILKSKIRNSTQPCDAKHNHNALKQPNPRMQESVRIDRPAWHQNTRKVQYSARSKALRIQRYAWNIHASARGLSEHDPNMTMHCSYRAPPLAEFIRFRRDIFYIEKYSISCSV